MTLKVAPTPPDQRGSRSPWGPEQSLDGFTRTGQAVEMLWPTENSLFWRGLVPAQLQMRFWTVRTAYSGLEIKKYSERGRKVGLET